MKPVALIIGSGGIGSATARRLAAEGYAVCVAYYRDLPDAVEGIAYYPVDVTDVESVATLLTSVTITRGVPSTIVYAVSAPLHFGRVTETPWSAVQQHIDVQQKGFFNVIHAAYAIADKKIRLKFIVLLSEVATGSPPSFLSAYVTAKYGLLGLVRSVSTELPAAWSCNTVSPPMTDTPLLKTVPEKVVELAAYRSVAGRLTTPDEVAASIAFLLSPEADALRGQDITVPHTKR